MLQLIDFTLERMLVAALIAHPHLHDDLALVASDIGDLRARAAFEAFANVRARAEPVNVDTLCQELQAQHHLRGNDGTLTEPELTWMLDLVMATVQADPPVAQWANQITQLAEARRGAVAEAEPPPRRALTGPRAKNEEPVRLAEAFMGYRYQLRGEPTLVRWARAWWRYDGTRYVELDDELLDRDIIGFLDVVSVPKVSRQTNMVSQERVTSKSKTVREVAKALHHVMPAIAGSAPRWIEPGPDDCIAVRNGILDANTRTLLPATPSFFSTTCIGCSYEPEAPQPERWLAFLHDLWGDDTESIRALQQIFGYLLTGDTSQQKLFALIGPPRSGKSTIARVLKALLGDDAVVNPTLQSLEQPFGLAPLVGKTVAIIGDARLGGKSDQAQVAERLLSISGEDALSVNRKNRDAINVRLRTRVLLLSNELPRIYDTSGALASRFIILCLTRTFLGTEDLGLEAKLLAELPGILRWALDGRDDLAESGRFISPASSARATEDLNAISNPLGQFVEDHLEWDPEAWTSCKDVHAAYKKWADENSCHVLSAQLMGRDLRTLNPALIVERKRFGDVRIKGYLGVRLL